VTFGRLANQCPKVDVVLTQWCIQLDLP
jgi:hypothetical protein